jgi:hypothetical protein
MLRFLRSLSFALVAAAVLAPAAAHAATKKAVYPTVSSISPRKVSIGQKLTVKGTHFRAGKGKTTVVFYRSGKSPVFVKSDTATSSKLVVTLPDKVVNLLAERNGVTVATQLRLRVVAAKMGKSWTKNSRSPIVSPKAAPAPSTPGGAAPAPAAAAAPPTCQQLAALAPDNDTDGDGISNAIELKYHVDPCIGDTDGDGMGDGWEYYSALQLNGASIPYPGTKPWPNPLDSSDATYDFDGDGLSAGQEYALWAHFRSGFPLVEHSDGTQNSGGRRLATGNDFYLDRNGDGNLTDDERDSDHDGLADMMEWNYRGTQFWWEKVMKDEKPYTRRQFSNPDPLEADTDGDGILDGADDQDNDGWPNFVEMQLTRGEVGYRVQPFNPCLPDPHASVCGRYIPIGEDKAWPPFDGTQAVYDAIPFGVPNYNYSTWVAGVAANTEPAQLGTILGPWDLSPWFREAWDGWSGDQNH